MLTSLLVPYIFFSLSAAIFNLLRGEVGKWIAFIAVVLRLFFPRHFPGIKFISFFKLYLALPSQISFCLVPSI
ncbi:hypothetical protein MANES_09G119850v8 [Manihot esculenta]|uniref:Uncharacterized protein n=1 Tax=Manihot esculenta TaxID=3983 RepID=A0ACB7H5L9_MANES|nr:hypothetical protein MANES_09G119850v8 [Manihot esculenta]